MRTPTTIDKPENPWKKRRKGPQTFMPPSRALLAGKDGRKATATWGYYGYGHWKCISCTGFLKWMLGFTTTDIVKLKLDELKIQWRWIEPNTARALQPPF